MSHYSNLDTLRIRGFYVQFKSKKKSWDILFYTNNFKAFLYLKYLF